ncbi:MAG: GNAT family N-acetyltransferase [candidate division SR1 bacterium]|nr:GNAT family N-acetyltransferase [candidate division SR1 bacterium]
MPTILRLATISDLPLIKYWDKKPYIIFASGEDADVVNNDWIDKQLRNPSKFVQVYIAELDSREIGMVQVCDPANEETHYWSKIGQGLRAIDIWLGEENDLGKGYGTTVMNLIIAKCFEDSSVKAIIIDPLVINNRAIRFYKRLGFKFVENKYFEKDYCAVYRLDRC